MFTLCLRKRNGFACWCSRLSSRHPYGARALTQTFSTLLAILVATAVSAALCVLLRPLLVRYALARPNARSSHREPTPQGGGIAVLLGAAAAACVALAIALPMPASDYVGVTVVLVGALLLAIVGAWDDIAPLPASVRLLLQGVCVGVVLAFAAPEVRVLPEPVPLALERGLALLAGIWFVNLTNFIDGLDWITLAWLAPLCAALVLLAAGGVLDPASGLLAGTLLGGLIGFAPFNKPVARIFLGDVGSLPLGLIGAYLLWRLAGNGALAAAIILPLYPVTDATVTLLRRLARGEKVWQAHRSHFYQQATDNGFPPLAVAGHVAALNVALAALAGATILWPAPAVQIGALAAALVLTTALLARFARRRRP